MFSRMMPARVRVVLDEQAVGGAARQGLNAQRPRAREQVQHPRAFYLTPVDAVGQDVEQRLAYPVRGRARVS